MNDPTMAENHVAADFDEWWQFDDRGPDDPALGPARQAEVTGRCTGCWGPVKGLKDSDGGWIRIECQFCGRSIEANDAVREAERMQLEAEDNLPQVRVGHGSVYDKKARFVLKILPDMDRDTTWFEQRVATMREAKPKRNRLDRRAFPLGSPGYLYAQASAFVAGFANLPREMSAISLADFHFGEPQMVGVEMPTAEATGRISGDVPAIHREPSNAVMMARMGTALVAGMVAAFACELGMKAILMTRQHELEKTHDLLKLYEALPEDSRKRLEADFADIAGVFREYRDVFGKWRYLEHGTRPAIGALVDTDRVLGLGKAARVIVDECFVAGLQYEIDVASDFEFTVDQDDASYSEQRRLRVLGHESAIPWDAILPVGRDERG